MTIFCSALGSSRRLPTPPSNVVVKKALISSLFVQNSTLFGVGGDRRGPNTAPNDNFLFGFGFISLFPHSSSQQCCGLKLALISPYFAQNSTLFGVGGKGSLVLVISLDLHCVLETLRLSNFLLLVITKCRCL